MNILIVGASAGLGRALAEEGARRGHNLLLSASDGRDLAAVASGLRLRYGVETACVAGDICCPDDRLRLLEVTASWLPLDGVLLPVGYSRADDTGSLDDRGAGRVLEVNFTALLFLIGSLWPRLVARDAAFVVGFGSVAAIRGRRRNVVYAAAKRALGSYFESLRALAVGTGICIQFYDLGYMKTQQAFGKKLLLPIACPDEVARMVFRRLGKSQHNLFYPRWWGLLAALVRRLPWFIYKRLEF